MSKIAIYCVALAATLTAGMTAGQAREINVFGSTFTVDDGPAIVPAAPSTPRFNATVANPERYDREQRRQIDLDRSR